MHANVPGFEGARGYISVYLAASLKLYDCNYHIYLNKHKQIMLQFIATLLCDGQLAECLINIHCGWFSETLLTRHNPDFKGLLFPKRLT